MNCKTTVCEALREAEELAWSVAHDRFEQFTATFITRISFEQFMETHEKDLQEHIDKLHNASLTVEMMQ